MNTPLMFDLCISLLASGAMTPEQQVAMSRDLLPVAIEHRKMRITLDELTREASEQDEIDRRREDEQRRLIANRLGLTVVVPFPRRPVRVDWATASAEGEWR